jgi:hypothetical protein
MSLKNKYFRMRNIAKIYPMLAFTILLFQLMSVSTANALEELSSEDLASHCALRADPEDVNGQYFVRYIQGFIDGAIATDARLMLNAEKTISGNETYADRAILTRMPVCLNCFRVKNEPAMLDVYQSLLNNYPCTQ